MFGFIMKSLNFDQLKIRYLPYNYDDVKVWCIFYGNVSN